MRELQACCSSRRSSRIPGVLAHRCNFVMMSSMSKIVQVKGSITFQVTDWDLEVEIDRLIRERSGHPAGKPIHTIANGNGRGTEKDGGTENRDKSFKILTRKFSTNQFCTSEALAIAKAGGVNVSRSAFGNYLQYWKEQGKLVKDKKEVRHFLESALTPLPAIGSGESKENTS